VPVNWYGDLYNGTLGCLPDGTNLGDVEKMIMEGSLDEQLWPLQANLPVSLCELRNWAIQLGLLEPPPSNTTPCDSPNCT
jgi:hypothetical protein